MQVVKNTFIILLSALIAFLIFMPKKELYYTLEHQLVKLGVKLNEKDITETVSALKIDGMKVYYEGIRLMDVESSTLTTFVFFNKINLHKIAIASSLKSMLPQNIDDINITYSVLSPMKANISANGDFGELKGYMDFNRTIHLDFVKVGDIKKFKRELKKNENGWYYENQF